MSASPETTATPTRPRYLAVALVLALVFGAGCWTEGCKQLSFYRGERAHHVAMNESVTDAADREHVESVYQRFVEISDAQRGRGVPLAAATFVLGAALLALASRGLGGKGNTRSALMQVVGAQAIVVALTYFAMRDTRNAELDWDMERTLVHERATKPAEQVEQVVVPSLRVFRRYAPGGWLALRTLASALILLALSRPRSRAFFEASAQQVPE